MDYLSDAIAGIATRLSLFSHRLWFPEQLSLALIYPFPPCTWAFWLGVYIQLAFQLITSALNCCCVIEVHQVLEAIQSIHQMDDLVEEVPLEQDFCIGLGFHIQMMMLC